MVVFELLRYTTRWEEAITKPLTVNAVSKAVDGSSGKVKETSFQSLVCAPSVVWDDDSDTCPVLKLKPGYVVVLRWQFHPGSTKLLEPFNCNVGSRLRWVEYKTNVQFASPRLREALVFVGARPFTKCALQALHLLMLDQCVLGPLFSKAHVLGLWVRKAMPSDLKVKV